MSKEVKEKKENKGHFKKGNESGKNTRFKKGNNLRCTYKEEYAESILAFFQSCETFPTIERWVVDNNLPMSTVSGWVTKPDKYRRFVIAYEKCKAIQKDKLINLGLNKRYDASMVKFLLINNHDMIEKSEQKIDGETSTDITINIREVN